MIQTIKNFLKRILPPPVRTFLREVERILAELRGQEKRSREQLKRLEEHNDSLMRQLAGQNEIRIDRFAVQNEIMLKQLAERQEGLFLRVEERQREQFQCLAERNEEQLQRIEEQQEAQSRRIEEQSEQISSQIQAKAEQVQRLQARQVEFLEELIAKQQAQLEYQEELMRRLEKMEKTAAAMEQRLANIESHTKKLFERIPAPDKRDHDFYRSIPSSKYEEELRLWYKRKTGKLLNLEFPGNYCEKIQWLKLHDSTPLKTRLTDKYLVRDWVKEKIGDKHLIPLLGVWDSFDEIDFDKLPDRFVLKATHGSGWNILVNDKAELDIEEAREKFNTWLSMNYAFKYGLELHYINIQPRIIAEDYIGYPGLVCDYKFMCFDGKVRFLWVDADRYTNHTETLFTPKWEKIDATIGYPVTAYEIPKPERLEEMVEIATELSQGFSHVRVDLYENENIVCFGEMTFTSGSGINEIQPKEFADKVNGWFHLPPASPLPTRKH